MYDPYARQLERQAEHRAHDLLRNKLILQARNLLRSAYIVDKTNPNALSYMIGSLEAHLDMRLSLAPAVALDGYQREIKGMVLKLKASLEELTVTPV
jgi:hypothetical protein